MVPIAKAAVLLVLLGGATVSTYAITNGGFGNKAKSSGGSEEVKTTDTNKGDAANTGHREEAASEIPAKGSPTPEPASQKPGEAVSTAEKGSKGGSDGPAPSASEPSVSSTT